MPQTPEYEAIIKNCDKQRIVNFLKTIFPGKGNANAKFGGTEEGAADGITILGSVTLLTGDGRPKPVLCCAKQMDGMLTERSSRRKQFDAAVKILKGQLSTRYSGHGTTPVPFTQGLFFFFDEQGNFRLSLVTAEISAGKMELNNYRRQSFFVEAGKNNKTFRTRLCKAIANFDELKSAFDVEKLSDEFFREYKVFYEDIVQYITGARYIEVKKNKYERKDMSGVNHEIYDQFEQAYEADAERAVRNYVKKLMGRLVFIQFLQKKGWLGNPAGSSKWDAGDRDFMQSLFLEVSPEDRENFIDNILEKIFFEEFNTKEENRHIENATLKKYRFPFLNCGLFDRDADDKLDFKLPAAVFCNLKFSDTERKTPNIKDWTKKRNPYFDDRACGLFDFFDRFNFTIDENDPTDAEVSVDPEMLGKIFENLLEDNKDKGAFYTPKEIVNYMVNESLIAYLGDDSRNRDFVLNQDSSAFTNNEKEQLNTKLAEVKICDPAIGSGAFPMGLLNLLCKCRQSLQPEEKQHDKKTIAALKRDIIQQNIYGVDIEKGAVDIARLRFWLSLIVDEETPEVLPNLEFKIMQGNSLLESYEGIDLSGLAGEKGSRTRAQSKDQLSLVFDEKQAMEQIQKDLNKFYKTDSHAEKESLTLSINNNVKEYIKYIAPQKSKEIDAMPVPNDRFFLWHTYFRDVFNRKGKEGFDIVIGNPPYKIIGDVEKKFFSQATYILVGHVDLYELFIQQGMNILRPSGVMVYINPNTLLSNLYSKDLRKKIIKDYGLRIIDNFKMDVFSEPTVHTCIMHYTKGVSFPQIQVRRGVETTESLNNDFDFTLFVNDIDRTENYTFDVTVDDNMKSIINKSLGFAKLGDICYLRQCIKTGNDKIYVRKSDVPLEDPWKKTLRGKGIERYHIKEDDVYLKYGNWLARNWSNTSFYERSKIAIRETGSRITACIDDENRYFLSSIFAIYPKDEYSENVLKFLLGILNSTFATYYIGKIAFELTAGAFTKMRTNQLARLPIPIWNQLSLQKPIVSLVNAIISAKKEDPSANTSKLEDEIDNLVYNLYGLTPEEIAIVKGGSSAQNDDGEKARSDKPHETHGSVADDDFLQGEDL